MLIYSAGVGRTIARVLAENGAARVYIIGRNVDNLRQTGEKYPEYVLAPVHMLAAFLTMFPTIV